MPFTINLENTDTSFKCNDGQNVLAAMERLGCKGIPVGCRGGGCGVCRVRVVGPAEYHTLKMSRAQVSEADAASGIALACKLIPESNLTVRPLGLLRKQVDQFLDNADGGM